MKWLLPVCSVLALVSLGAELRHYRIEYRVRRAEDAVQIAADPRAARIRAELLSRVADDMRTLTTTDSGAALNAANASLLRGDAPSAEAITRRALASTERPELLLLLAYALEQQGRDAEAERAAARAVWIAPALIRNVGALEPRVRDRVSSWERRLAAGTLQRSELEVAAR